MRCSSVFTHFDRMGNLLFRFADSANGSMRLTEVRDDPALIYADVWFDWILKFCTEHRYGFGLIDESFSSFRCMDHHGWNEHRHHEISRRNRSNQPRSISSNSFDCKSVDPIDDDLHLPSQGIATWGCVSGHNQLDVHGSNVQYFKPGSEQKGEAPLEPNHTEFIFIDDGTERKYGGEIAFRAKLEDAISGGFFGLRNLNNAAAQTTTLTNTASIKPEESGLILLILFFHIWTLCVALASDPIPVVLIVVEGGPNTVRTGKTRRHSLKSGNQPLISCSSWSRRTK